MSLPLIKPYLSKFLSKKLSLALLTSLALIACSPATDKEADANDPVVDASQTEAMNNATNEVSRETVNQQGNIAAIEQPITILALGDSLTEGLGVDPDDNYPAQLESTLKDMGYENVKVINSGLSGETSTGLINRLDWVAQTKPDITILTIGANDAIRGIDVATVEANIRTAVKRLQDNGSEVILGGMQIYDNLGSDYVQSFAAIYPRVAKDMNVTLIPFFLNGVGGDPELNQADAIHPTKDGYTVIVNDNILPILAPKLEAMVENESN
ncbi:arylesterase [Psychrobacter sp. P11G5]|uniref:arylesterase n=1 Tax=Psychrobacter sp. P11G5 TaxID=1699624 RepID=UPI00078E6622|nr:arylesterase [Psychrobacter sp. P11G5]AMN68621.1 lysophospholipase [Psychrobacter sp. P11G5]